jgi:restriction endonuclease S subunit
VSTWQKEKLGNLAEVLRGNTITRKEVSPGEVPVIAGGQTPSCYHNVWNREGKTITISASGAYAGFVQYFEIPIFASDCSTVKVKDENRISSKFLFYMLQALQTDIYALQRGSGQPHVYPSQLVELEIPTPPSKEQSRIVDFLEAQFELLDSISAKLKQVEIQASNLVASVFHELVTSRSKTLGSSKFSNEMTLQRGFDLPKQDRDLGVVPIIASNGEVGRHKIAKVKAPGVVTGRSGTIGRVHYVVEDFWPLNTTLYVKDFKGNDPEFIRFYLQNMHLETYAGGSTVPSLDRNVLSDIEVYFPKVQEQLDIVQKIKHVELSVAGIIRLCRSVEADGLNLKRSILQAAFSGKLTKEVVSV